MRTTLLLTASALIALFAGREASAAPTVLEVRAVGALTQLLPLDSPECGAAGCVQAFEFELVGDHPGHLREYILKQVPAGSTQYRVECTRVFIFDEGTITTHNMTMIDLLGTSPEGCVPGVDAGCQIQATLVTHGPITGGTGAYQGVRGNLIGAGPGTMDAETLPLCIDVAYRLIMSR